MSWSFSNSFTEGRVSISLETFYILVYTYFRCVDHCKTMQGYKDVKLVSAELRRSRFDSGFCIPLIGATLLGLCLDSGRYSPRYEKISLNK
jgi:hypothetical protein